MDGEATNEVERGNAIPQDGDETERNGESPVDDTDDDATAQAELLERKQQVRQQEAQAFNARDAAQIQKRSENDLLKHVIANALAEREQGEGAEVAAVQHEAERMCRG